jgi:cell division protein FtsL
MNFIKNSLITLLGIAILITGVSIAYCTHQARQLQNDLQILLKEKDALRSQWTQLLLEQSVWATDLRIDTMARNDLAMSAPANSSIVVIQP